LKGGVTATKTRRGERISRATFAGAMDQGELYSTVDQNNRFQQKEAFKVPQITDLRGQREKMAGEWTR
jgi:hypothetical protein